MVEIIRRGTPPNPKPIRTTCHHCDTEFSFLPDEAKLIAESPSRDFYQLPCPVCNKLITVCK